MSNEDRHAVSISGDIHDNVEANGSAEKSGDVSLHVCDTPTATLSATAAANNYPEDPDVKPISADAPSVVQAQVADCWDHCLLLVQGSLCYVENNGLTFTT